MSEPNIQETPIYTVLCVDDEVNILQAMKRILRKQAFNLLTAQSGAQALELMAEHLSLIHI